MSVQTGVLNFMVDESESLIHRQAKKECTYFN